MESEEMEQLHSIDRAVVKEITETSRLMAKSLETNSNILAHLEKTYAGKLEQAIKSRDELHDSYIKLLHKYEQLEADYISTLKELARRPTITNTTGE